jgi:hypothetical protein
LATSHLVARVDEVRFLSGASISAASKLAPSLRASIVLCHRHCRQMPPRFLATLSNAFIPAAKLQAMVLTEAGLVAKGQMPGRTDARPA